MTQAETPESTADTGLLDRTERLRQQIAALGALRAVANEAMRLRTRAEELERPTEQLESWMLVLMAFRPHGIPVTFDPAVALSVRQLAARVARDFADDPKSILEPDATLRRAFWTPLNSLPELLGVAIRTAWVDHLDHTIPQRQDDLLEVLAGLPGFGEQVQRIRALYRTADELKRTFGKTSDLDAMLQQPKVLAARISQAVAQLEGPGIPAEVLAFVKAASTPTGATLEQYTEVVREWLERNDLLATVRLRLRGAV